WQLAQEILPSTDKMGSKKSLRPRRTLPSVSGLSAGVARLAARPSGTASTDSTPGKVSFGSGTGSDAGSAGSVRMNRPGRTRKARGITSSPRSAACSGFCVAFAGRFKAAAGQVLGQERLGGGDELELVLRPGEAVALVLEDHVLDGL